MPSCVGSPDTDCPCKAHGSDVHFRYAELDLCPSCEHFRRQVNNEFISDSLITEVTQWENRHKNFHNLDFSVIGCLDVFNDSESDTIVKQKFADTVDNQISKQQKNKPGNEVVYKKYICNGLLCFIQNKMDIVPQSMVIKTAVDFYSDHEVKTAKDLLFDTCANSANPPMRNTGRTGSGKNEKHLTDTYALIGRIPTDKLSVFTAANLPRLPALDLECFDLSTLSQQVKEMRIGVKTESDLNNLLVEFPVLKAQINELLIMKSDIDKMKTEIQDLTQVRTTVSEMSHALELSHNQPIDCVLAGNNLSASKSQIQGSKVTRYAEATVC